MAEKAEGQMSKPRVMIIDDCGMVLRNIKEMLSARYDVSIAVSGKLALTRLKDVRPQVILLDYDMPEMNGRETFDAIRKHEYGKDVPIIYLTGMDESETIVTLIRQHPAGYVLKPPKPEKLILTIENALRSDN